MKIKLPKKQSLENIRNFFYKRKWKYFKDPDYDQHIFHLVDPVLGRWNKLQLEFYKSK